MLYPHISQIGSNELVSLFCLNTDFYANAGWGNSHAPVTQTTWYVPYKNVAKITTVVIKGKEQRITVEHSTYTKSISYDTGYFQPKLLQAEQIKEEGMQNIPIQASRYQPTKDDGLGNKLWLVSVLN